VREGSEKVDSVREREILASTPMAIERERKKESESEKRENKNGKRKKK
jgi:hypothetical protein